MTARQRRLRDKDDNAMMTTQRDEENCAMKTDARRRRQRDDDDCTTMTTLHDEDDCTKKTIA
jgi:hypothetical protein